MTSSTKSLGLYRFAALLFAAACASPSTTPALSGFAQTQAVARSQGPTLYAFEPSAQLVAGYDATASGRTKPTSLLAGSNTQLSAGNGIAVGADGTLYVVVATSPLQLLVFAPGATGDTPPERTEALQARLIPGYAVGLALDGLGNFWITAGNLRELLRFPASANGTVSPNAKIELRLATPIGKLRAHPSNVAVDSNGHVYCACALVHQGNQAIGVSEYVIRQSGKPELVRSFYDFSLPEIPPAAIAIDNAGTMYLASPQRGSGVFVYDAATKSGQAHFNRHIYGNELSKISSLTTDPAGNLYVAVGSRIGVFGPHANGNARPQRWISDKRHLAFGDGDYGTLLSIH